MYPKQNAPTINFQNGPPPGNFFFSWCSLHAKLNSHHKKLNYKKKIVKEPKVKGVY